MVAVVIVILLQEVHPPLAQEVTVILSPPPLQAVALPQNQVPAKRIMLTN